MKVDWVMPLCCLAIFAAVVLFIGWWSRDVVMLWCGGIGVVALLIGAGTLATWAERRDGGVG